MNYIADYIMIPVQLIVVFFTLYYFIIGFFGLYRPKEKKILTPKKTFAVLVAAHNEEQVIGQLVANLKVLKYPKELYDIFVIADNCTDSTAQIAKEAGAIVCERFNDKERGKGYAMEWMFHKLFKMERQYDAIVVFDADNLVHPDFLLEMNNRLCKGERVIQGYLDAKNPCDTWTAGVFSISFWVANHLWHLAKYNIGFSCILGGTGMCIATDVLKEFGWGATCLTEDLEFTMKVLIKGIRTTWAHDAIVYDEKALTFMQSWRQRKRWAQGYFDVAGRCVPQLLKAGIKKRDIRILDGIIPLLQPHFLIMSSLFFVASYVCAYIPFYTNVLSQIIPPAVWAFIGFGQYLFPMIIMAKVRAPGKTWLYLILYPLFIYSWVPITVLGFIHRKDTEWSHTKHTRAMSYNDMLADGATKFAKQEIVSKQAAK